MLNVEVGAAMDREPRMLLKTIGARRAIGDGHQGQGVEAQASLTVFSRTDRPVPDYGVSAGHPAGR
jgi:hypothetical protein